MSTIKLRRSAIPGKIPTVGQLELGELAVNTYDGRLYIKKNVDSVESIVGIYGLPVSDESIYVNNYTGDGNNTVFELPRIPRGDQYVYAFINGVQQDISKYSITGNTIVFNSAPLAGQAVELRTHDSLTSSVSVRDYTSYVYTANNNTTFSGIDDNGNTLAYDIGKLEVYVNGSRLVNGVDYTASNGTSVVVAQAVTGTVEIVSLALASFQETRALTPSEASFTTTTANQVADSFQAAAYRSAKYMIQMTAGSSYHVTEVLLIHDGTTVFITEYGTILTGSSLGTIDADISGGLVRLLVTPSNANTTVKTQRITISV